MLVEGVVAGVVAVAGIFDDLQDVVVDRKAGGTVAGNFCTDDVLYQMFGLDQVGFQVRRGLIAAQLVAEPVGGYLVPAVVDITNEVGQALGDPAEDEEGSLHQGCRFIG